MIMAPWNNILLVAVLPTEKAEMGGTPNLSLGKNSRELGLAVHRELPSE